MQRLDRGLGEGAEALEQIMLVGMGELALTHLPAQVLALMEAFWFAKQGAGGLYAMVILGAVVLYQALRWTHETHAPRPLVNAMLGALSVSAVMFMMPIVFALLFGASLQVFGGAETFMGSPWFQVAAGLLLFAFFAQAILPAYELMMVIVLYRLAQKKRVSEVVDRVHRVASA